MSHSRMFLICALSAALPCSACSSEGEPPDVTAPEPPPAPSPTQLLKSGGDQQAWYFGNPLPEPYAVTVRGEDGAPMSGVAVTWAVASGSGSVDPKQVATDTAGQAVATHVLGPTATSQSVTASVAGLPAITFDATATAPPTEAFVSVHNNFFEPSDVVLQVGGTNKWTWVEPGVFHNVTYTAGLSPFPAGSRTQDSGTHSNTYEAATEYRYVCTIHAGMEGTVTVVR